MFSSLVVAHAAEHGHTQIGIVYGRVATGVGEYPAVLRLENLDTDLRPAEAALRATQTAVDDEANSWLPFTGKLDLKCAVAEQLAERSGIRYNPETQAIITCGEGEAMVDAPLRGDRPR